MIKKTHSPSYEILGNSTDCGTENPSELWYLSQFIPQYLDLCYERWGELDHPKSLSRGNMKLSR